MALVGTNKPVRWVLGTFWWRRGERRVGTQGEALFGVLRYGKEDIWEGDFE